MPAFGGMSPFPLRLGGGTPRLKLILDSLNQDRGTALDATNRDSYVYAINMAIARALNAAWGTNERLARIWDPMRTSEDIIERWERMMALNPAPSATLYERKVAVANQFQKFGQAAETDFLSDELEERLGSVFVAVEYISLANAAIKVPDATYPWGSYVPGSSPWSSTVAHILVRLQKPTGYSEGEFYEAAGEVLRFLDPILPVWATVDWYRPGPVSVNVTGGPSAGGFYMDDDHNLDNEVIDA